MDAKEVQRSLRQELDNEEERYLLETLAMLQESYATAAKPYIDRLVAIHSLRPPAQVVMSIERLHYLWEMKLDQGMPANVDFSGSTPLYGGESAGK